MASLIFESPLPQGTEAPDRQGCTVFREHWWFDNLPAGVPANQNEAEALRQFLYTYVHEIGHAFNLLHSWQKGFANPPADGDEDDLSWMNYPSRYDGLPGNNPGAFWNAFPLQFEDPELLHLRHGDRPTVIFGGEPFGQGAALGNPLQVVGEAPIRFIIRGKRYFHFLEPVILEFKLKNSSQDVGLALPMELDTELNPQYDSVMLHIQRPNGRILAYEPAMHILREPRLKQLHPGPQGRYCQNVLVSFGKYGHYFDEPGLYRVRGLYRGLNNMLVASNVHELRVGRPFSRDEERDAQDFYSWAAGMALYLGGSDSPYLRSGMDCLRRVAKRHEQSPVGAHLSLVLAQNLSRPFRRVVEVGREHIEVAGRLVEVVQSRREERQPDLQEALKLVDRALQQHSRDNNTFQNITYHHCSRTRANLLATIGQRDEAKNELDRLIPYLSGRGVKEDVLAEIESYKQTL